MKLFFIVTFVIMFSNSFSQNFGDTYEQLMEHKEELGINLYRIYSNHYEVLSITDTLKTCYQFDFKQEKIYGIDYEYQDQDALAKALGYLIKDAYKIGYYFWISDNIIIIAFGNIIQTKDINRISKKALKRYTAEEAFKKYQEEQREKDSL